MKLAQIIATATTAAVLGTAGVTVAGATTGSGATIPDATFLAAATGATTPATGTATGTAKGPRALRHAVKIAAGVIGISPHLAKELRAGKSISQVATDHHVDVQKVIDALVQAADQRIEAAKTAGRITAARAAQLEARVPAMVDKLVAATHIPGRRAAALRRNAARAGVKVAAGVIGISPADLAKELRAGKSIAEVATEHHVDVQTVVDAIVKAGTDKIEAAKSAGKISADRAARLEARLPAFADRLVHATRSK